MISSKKHVQQLAFLLQAKGISDVVVSPGSRSGPLVHTFTGAGFDCRSVVDERSAAYFALGLAQALQKPVALVCSSGTATLNYAPAVAEAFYLKIPLIVLTADRPAYRINQGENQTLPQQNIYKDFCKKAINLPLEETEKALWFAGRLINETLNTAVTGLQGPVHINIPLEEPLHELTGEILPAVKVIEVTATKTVLNEEELERLAGVFNRAGKVMILAGQMPANTLLEKALLELTEKTGAVVLHEHLSNLKHEAFVGNIDLLLTSLLKEPMDDFRPNLLITLGGTFVSKPLKQFLRQNKPENHWHLEPGTQYHDTYEALTRIIETDALTFLEQFSEKTQAAGNAYQQRWKEKEEQVKQLRNEFIDQTGWCDLKIFNRIMRSLPQNSVVHLGNSSPVRYALLFDAAKDVAYFGNRGTSGIDGSLSTAVGYASASGKINTVIVGDLSFFYDSNALWNKYPGPNLRIIVIHNGGGNIFSMIKGPAETPAFNEFFFTENRVSAAGLAQTFNLRYFKAENEMELELMLKELYSPEQKKAALLELITDASLNAEKFRALFKKMKIDRRDI